MTHTLEFKELPSAWLGLAKAAVSRGSGLSGGATIPRIAARCSGVVADADALRKYRKLCSFRIDGKLPPSYPHVLAAPLHLQVMTHKEFPFRLLGAVHVRNAVTQHRAIGANEVLDIKVHVEGHRDVDAGVEFDLVTQVSDTSGSVVWESTSTNLIRMKRAGGGKSGGGWTPPDWSAYQLVESWKMPGNIGRRYGIIAGDVNPIHMHALAARAFGFKRAIAHGMYTYARCVARIIPAGVPRVGLTVSFKKPIYLPSRVELLMREDAEGRDYLLTDIARETVFLEGRVDFAGARRSASSRTSSATATPVNGSSVVPEPAAKAAGKKAATKKRASAKKTSARKSATKKAATKKRAAKKAAGKSTTPGSAGGSGSGV